MNGRNNVKSMQNISEICNIFGSQKNIVGVICSNFTHNSFGSFIARYKKCSKCNSYICNFCANENFDKCVMCCFDSGEIHKNDWCESCFGNIVYFMCNECSKIIRNCLKVCRMQIGFVVISRKLHCKQCEKKIMAKN